MVQLKLSQAYTHTLIVSQLATMQTLNLIRVVCNDIAGFSNGLNLFGLFSWCFPPLADFTRAGYRPLLAVDSVFGDIRWRALDGVETFAAQAVGLELRCLRFRHCSTAARGQGGDCAGVSSSSTTKKVERRGAI